MADPKDIKEVVEAQKEYNRLLKETQILLRETSDLKAAQDSAKKMEESAAKVLDLLKQDKANQKEILKFENRRISNQQAITDEITRRAKAESDMIEKFKTGGGIAAAVAIMSSKTYKKAMSTMLSTFERGGRAAFQFENDVINSFGSVSEGVGKNLNEVSNAARKFVFSPEGIGGIEARLNRPDSFMKMFSMDAEKASEEVQKSFVSLTTNSGENFSRLQKEFGSLSQESVVQLAGLTKAIGATDNDVGDLASRAVIFGRSMKQQMFIAADASKKFGKAFGVPQKAVARGMNELRKDFQGFGTFSEQQLARTAAAAAKLGVSMQGIKQLNLFDNFDKTAESAAMLGQAFGLNIDAFALFNEERPEERLRMIQQAASQAGLDIAGMSRVEMNYLADLTQLPVADVMKTLGGAGQELADEIGEGPTAADSARELVEIQKKLKDETGTLLKDLTALVPTYIDSADTIKKTMSLDFKENARVLGDMTKAGLKMGESLAGLTKQVNALLGTGAFKQVRAVAGGQATQAGQFAAGEVAGLLNTAQGNLERDARAGNTEKRVAEFMKDVQVHREGFAERARKEAERLRKKKDAPADSKGNRKPRAGETSSTDVEAEAPLVRTGPNFDMAEAVVQNVSDDRPINLVVNLTVPIEGEQIAGTAFRTTIPGIGKTGIELAQAAAQGQNPITS